MHNRLVAGVDCSTQSTKVMVVDVDKGGIKASGRVEHDVFRGTRLLVGGGVLRSAEPDRRCVGVGEHVGARGSGAGVQLDRHASGPGGAR